MLCWFSEPYQMFAAQLQASPGIPRHYPTNLTIILRTTGFHNRLFEVLRISFTPPMLRVRVCAERQNGLSRFSCLEQGE